MNTPRFRRLPPNYAIIDLEPMSVKVSIIMSVFNGLPYLNQAIESILAQSFTDFEFLIVDDASMDQSLAVLKVYAKKDTRIRILMNNSNLGLTRSLNRALSEAKGEFIARQDSDDISLPERFQLQVEFLRDHPDVGLLGSRTEEIDDHGAISGPQRVSFAQTIEEIDQLKFQLNPLAHSSVMIRRKLLNAVGGYDESIRYAQDYECWLRLLQTTKAVNLPQVLVQRRYSPGMISLSRKKEQLKSVLRTKRKYRHLFKLKDHLFYIKDLFRWLSCYLKP